MYYLLANMFQLLYFSIPEQFNKIISKVVISKVLFVVDATKATYQTMHDNQHHRKPRTGDLKAKKREKGFLRRISSQCLHKR